MAFRALARRTPLLCTLALFACGASENGGGGVPPDATAPPDLSVLEDLAVPDLAMPDLAKPDLATPDLAMPDLSVAPADLVPRAWFVDQCPAGTSTTVTGTTWAPNGVDPVPAAFVYVPAQVNRMPKGVACDSCSKIIDPQIVVTTSAIDGKFTLYLDNVPFASQIVLVVNKGHFRRVTTIPVHCGANDMAATPTVTTLPGNSKDGDIPKIAVGTGAVDHLDKVLTALGITEWTCLEGRKNTTYPASCTPVAPLGDLLTGQNGYSLDDYNMVFIGCAPGAWANLPNLGVSQAQVSTNLAAWVGKGGRLFVTDNSYDYVAQAFPSSLAWQGPQSMPWTVDGANVGVGGTTASPATLQATVDDANLASWLGVVGATQPSDGGAPTVTVGGILNKWSVQAAVPTGTSQIADGVASYTDPSGATKMTDVPLTSQFAVNSCGKVLYSSYHTLSSVNANMLSAQEKILEYLMLDAASCTPGM